MRLIDAEILVRKAIDRYKKAMGTSVGFGMGVITSMISDAPTIDAVPVVRCKDCKHRGNHEVCPLMDIRLCFDGDGHMDEVEDDKTEDEFFCSYGERKDGNGYYKKQSSCTTPDGKEWFASGAGKDGE